VDSGTYTLFTCPKSSQGLIRALETFPHSKQPLLLKTDSKYAIQCMPVSLSESIPRSLTPSGMEEWIHGWIKKGWKKSDGQPVLNAPLIRCLSALLDERAFSGQKVDRIY
jgi:ribonuclease HI